MASVYSLQKNDLNWIKFNNVINEARKRNRLTTFGVKGNSIKDINNSIKKEKPAIVGMYNKNVSDVINDTSIKPFLGTKFDAYA